jgi:membrane-associated phospholipid phosphatase
VLRSIVFVLAAGAAVFLLFGRDVDLLQLRFWLIGDEPKGLLKQSLGSFREFGQAMAAIVAMCIIATCDRRAIVIIVVLLLAEGLAAVGYNAGKLTIARYRPSAAIDLLKTEGDADKAAVVARMKPGDSWIGWRPWNRDAKTQSFPSGHSAGAVVLAATLGAFYPRLRWLFWMLAIGCALSRYLDAAHWPSDCLAGGAIGYAAARISMMICGQPKRIQY